MLFKIAFQNIRNAKSYFLAYALTISAFAILIYSINVTQIHFESVDTLLIQQLYLLAALDIVKVFVYSIVIAFSIYIIHFFIRRRYNEIALYKLYGMKTHQIMGLFFIENSIIIFLAFFCSIIFGMFFSRIMLMFAASFLEIELTNYPLTITWNLIKQIVVFLFIIFIIMNIMPIRLIGKTTIKQLFIKSSTKNNIPRFPWLSVIMFLGTAIALIYFLVIYPPNLEFNIFFVIFFLAILVVFFMYRGVFFTFFYFIKKTNFELRNPILLISSNHFLANINTLNFILSFVTVLTAIGSVFIVIVFGFFNTTVYDIDTAREEKVSFIAFSENDKETLSQAFQDNNLEYNLDSLPFLFYSKHNPHYSADDEESEELPYYSFAFIKKTDITQLINNDTVIDAQGKTALLQALQVVNRSQYLTLSTDNFETEIPDISPNLFQYNQTLSDYLQRQFISDSSINATIASNRKEQYRQFYRITPIIIDDEAWTQRLLKYPKYQLLINNCTYNKLERDLFINVFYSLHEYLGTQGVAQADIQLYAMNYLTIIQKGTILFINSLFQISFFLVAIAAILALIMSLFFRTLEVIENNLEEYAIAHSLGLSMQQLYHIIALETGFSQLLPFFIGIIGGLLVFAGSMKFLGFDAFLSENNYGTTILFATPTLFLFFGFILIIILLYLYLNYNIRKKLRKKIK